MRGKFAIILILAITAAFLACNKETENDAADQIDAAVVETQVYAAADSYSKILTGDFSDFAGIWVNGRGQRARLTPDGVFTLQRSDGNFTGGLRASGFKRENDIMMSDGSFYMWSNADVIDGSGTGMWLFPAGADILRNGALVQTDAAKDRIYAGSDILSSIVIFYREDLYAMMTDQIASVEINNEQELHIGSTLSGSINSGGEIWYSIAATEAGFLTIEAMSFIDTYIMVYDSRHNYLNEGHGGEGVNPRVEIITQSDSVYHVRFCAYDVSNFGESVNQTNSSFQIRASFRPLPEIVPLYSGFASGYIEPGHEIWFKILVSGKGIINIHTTGDTDTYLELYTVNFDFITGDDDSGENTNAKITNLEVSPGQEFLIKLRAYGDRFGPYDLIARVDSYPVPIVLNPGSFINGYIESNQEIWYSVHLQYGGTLVVETTGTTDTTLEAFTIDYHSITYNDDTWTGDVVERNAKITLWVTQDNYTVLFRLKSFNSGSFRIFAAYYEGVG